MSEENSLKAEERNKLHYRSDSPWPAFLVIAVGLALLAANLFNVHLINVLWPGFIIAPGLMLLWPAYISTADNENQLSFLAVPGAIVTMVGLILFVMNLANHFEAWAYSWALIPVAFMAGLMYAKRFDPDSKIHDAGKKIIQFMVVVFVGFAVLFEIVIFENFTPWLPLALIAYGVYLLIRGRREAA